MCGKLLRTAGPGGGAPSQMGGGFVRTQAVWLLYSSSLTFCLQKFLLEVPQPSTSRFQVMTLGFLSVSLSSQIHNRMGRGVLSSRHPPSHFPSPSTPTSLFGTGLTVSITFHLTGALAESGTH